MTRKERRVLMNIDLTGSRLGPGWRSVELEFAPPDDWTDPRIRIEAALHYGVPVAQVSDPWPKTWEDERADV